MTTSNVRSIWSATLSCQGPLIIAMKKCSRDYLRALITTSHLSSLYRLTPCRTYTMPESLRYNISPESLIRNGCVTNGESSATTISWSTRKMKNKRMMNQAMRVQTVLTRSFTPSSSRFHGKSPLSIQQTSCFSLAMLGAWRRPRLFIVR